MVLSGLIILISELTVVPDASSHCFRVDSRAAISSGWTYAQRDPSVVANASSSAMPRISRKNGLMKTIRDDAGVIIAMPCRICSASVRNRRSEVSRAVVARLSQGNAQFEARRVGKLVAGILLKELASVGVRKFRVLRYVPSHRKDMLKHIPPREIVMKYIPIIKETAKKHNIDLLLGTPPGLYPSSYSSVDMIYEGVHPAIYTCPAGKTEFDILPNGDVYPCMSFKNKPEMYCGNILEKSVYELWNSKPMRMLRQLTPADYTGICGQCKRKWTCYSCRCVAYNLTGDLYGDDLTCYIVREKLGLIETEEDSLEALDFHCKCE